MIGLGNAKKVGTGVAVVIGAVLIIDGYVHAPSKADAAGTSGSAHVSALVAKGPHVDSSTTLTRRSGATTAGRSLGTLAPGAGVTIRCVTTGQSVAGDRTWYRLSNGSYVSGKYVADAGSPKHC